MTEQALVSNRTHEQSVNEISADNTVLSPDYPYHQHSDNDNIDVNFKKKKRATIAHTITVEGHGLHNNLSSRLEFHPVAFGSGINFVYDGNRIPADFRHISDTRLCSCLKNNDNTLSTVEHVMAALALLSISDIDMHFTALTSHNTKGEIPIMDGSAIEFINALQSAKICYSHDQYYPTLIINKKITCEDGDKYIHVEPSMRPFYSVSIDFGDDNAIAQQHAKHYILEEDLPTILGSARTFCLKQDIEMMYAQNLALGGSLRNAVVVDGMKIINPEGLRYKNEFARHKLLDLIGDLALSGFCIIGNITAHKVGHQMTNNFLKILFADPDNYTIIS